MENPVVAPEKLKEFFTTHPGSTFGFGKTFRLSPNEPARIRLSATTEEINLGEFQLFGQPARPKASVNCCRQPHESEDLDN